MGNQDTPQLKILEAPLEGMVLVEASAGTGKTYTIAGLFIRLITEGRATIDQILVVTYTKAATAELRDRIRKGLTDAVEAFQMGGSDDVMLNDLVACCEDREQALLHLANALLAFDEVAIYTIHGFCQRALADHAFEGGMPFETEVLTSDKELLTQIVQDFWRREIYSAPGILVDYLLEQKYSPEMLMSWVCRHVEKPFLTILAPGEVDFSAEESALNDAYIQARTMWGEESEDICGLIIGNEDLNGTKYRKASIPGWLTKLDEYLSPARPGLAAPSELVKFTTSYLAEGVKKGRTPPTHAFFDVCEALEHARLGLFSLLDAKRRCLLAALVKYANQELETRKQSLQVQSFGDLLLHLAHALKGADGVVLAEALRGRYSAALIDEFQDTDPIQYEIFHTIYKGSGLPVYLVGDPKQAIYSFRGADVFTYLNGRKDAQEHYTLKDNWRSSPALINAVNTLFEATESPFVFDSIPFESASAADQTRESMLHDGNEDLAPLKIWFVGKSDAGKAMGKEQTKQMATSATATEIARLLNQGVAGESRIGDKPLAGGDIAVLVRSHPQALMVRKALARLGIPSVEQSQESVFRSNEAMDIERLLIAIADPGRESQVKAALTTDLFGVTGDEIARFPENEADWEAWMANFHDWHLMWRERGFIRTMRNIMETQGIAKRLLGRADGHRRMTNVRHVVELLQSASSDHSGMESLIQWLAEQRMTDLSRSEEAQLRLENDEHLVKIVTIHKSKGLQYSIVFCPFVWDGKLWADKEDTHSLHDPQDNFKPVLDLRGEDAAKAIAQREELAENLRLLYVALTRAKHCCYMVWGSISEAGTSAPGWLLHTPDIGHSVSDVKTARQLFNECEESELLNRLAELREKANGAIEVLPIVDMIDSTRFVGTATTSTDFQAREFSGLTRQPWRVTSYSALAHHSSVSEGHDYDAITAQQEHAEATGMNIYTFPRGARPGQCLHAVFENIDFTNTDEVEIEATIGSTLRAFGYDDVWVPVITGMVKKVLATPLDEAGTVRLAAVSNDRRLNELEFYYPIANITPEGMKSVLQENELAEDVVLRQQIESLSFFPVEGYMKGFIDLTFEVGGRYYILDYKSNWLGGELADYVPERLNQAMADSDYKLQYLIYIIALHRYLRVRIPEYDYDTHFGGVFYLFLRGIDPGSGQDTGIYRDRPGKGLIEALDDYLENGTDIEREAANA
jgi:exodeoxyribonuclease V beta subunit